MNNNLTNSNFNDNLTSTSSAKFNIINTNNTNFIELNSSNNEFIIDPNSTGIHLGSIIINSKNNSFINRLIDQVSVNHNKKMTSIINNEDVNNNLTNFYIDIASNEANNSKTDFNQTEIVSQSSTSILNSSSTISPSTTSPSSIITLLKNSFNLSSNNQLTTESLPKLSMTKTIPLTELQQTISSNSTQIPLISQITMPSQISTTNFTNMTTSTLTTTSSIYNINPSEYDDDYISSCFSSPEDYDLFTATICATFFVFGILYTIYGYRCFKSVLFFTGFLFATIVIYFICLSESLMPIYGNIGVSLIAGFLFGLITLLVAYVGLFMLGFHLGLLIAMASLIVIYLTAPFVDWLLVPSSGWILFAIFMTLGLTGACGTLYFQRGCSIIATVLYGSTLTLICVDYFIENFKLLFWFRDKLKECLSTNEITQFGGQYSPGITKTVSLCTVSWVLMAIWPISVILGLIIQWCFTSKGIGYENDYNYGVVQSTASRKSGQLNRVRQEEHRLEQKQRKYRYLYQVRTAHGDVISQQYIQNLQRKFCPEDSMTYNSDISSHLTVIPSDSRNTTLSIA